MTWRAFFSVTCFDDSPSSGRGLAALVTGEANDDWGGTAASSSCRSSLLNILRNVNKSNSSRKKKGILQPRRTYESDKAWSNKFLAAAVASEVNAFLWGTSKDFYVPKDSRSSSLRFLFPWAAISWEVADGGERLGDLVLSEPSTSSLSRLSLASESSLLEADSCGSSPASGSGGLEESKTCFYKKKQVKTFRSSTRRQNCEYTTLQFTHYTLGKDLLAEYGDAGHGGITLFFVNLVKERTCFWTVSSGTSSSKVLNLSFKPD
jgi:hypothetical protein